MNVLAAEKRLAILEAMAAGQSLRAISAKHQCSINTVMKLKREALVELQRTESLPLVEKATRPIARKRSPYGPRRR